MNTKGKLPRVPVTSLPDGQLMDLYLTLPQKQREEQFVSTARAGAIAGVSQRTIQWWIEMGAIRTVRVGKRYKASVDSLKAYLKGQAGESEG